MYATILEADNYVKEYYSSSDPLRIHWEGLSEDDKKVQLNRSEQMIDLLPLKGRPVTTEHAFPRIPYQEESIELVKIATIELSIKRLDESALSRIEAQMQGVASYKIGDLSETFIAGSNQTLEDYVSKTVFPYLKNWLGGGYCICHTPDCR